MRARLSRLPLLVTLGGALVAVGCATSATPDPRAFATEYAASAARGDADAVYEMLSESGKKMLTREQVKRNVAEQKAEFAELEKQLKDPQTRFETEARVRFADGEQAALMVEPEGFRISAADALPAEARTVTQALGQLRRVLARRSYSGLIRVLSPRVRAMVEEDLRTLVLGLEQPEALDVDAVGNTATVEVPGGHFVKLRRHDGVWHVEDFD